MIKLKMKTKLRTKKLNQCPLLSQLKYFLIKMKKRIIKFQKIFKINKFKIQLVLEINLHKMIFYLH